MRELWFAGLARLRYEPTEMRIRVRHGGVELVDTTRAVLVWEPRRVVPSYAVPLADVRAETAPSQAGPTEPPPGILHPGIPFAAHSCPGQVMDVVVGDVRLAGAGFRPEDAELAEYVVLDFKAFDEWFEEEERLVSHPREPYHRVDDAVLPAARGRGRRPAAEPEAHGLCLQGRGRLLLGRGPRGPVLDLPGTTP